MRIFKNRGDIYFSKSNKEKSKEQKLLFSSLALIVTFTVVFLSIVAIKSDFSAKKFFAPDELSSEGEAVDELLDEDLPEVEGKMNYLFLIGDSDNLLFCTLIQSDMDNKAFKVCTLRADTRLDGDTMSAVYKNTGAGGVVNMVTAGMGIEVDYYINLDSKAYESFFNRLGTVHYPIASDIRYRESKHQPGYTLKLSAGEQNLDGKHFINLTRYYLDGVKNCSYANELMLSALTQQLNSDKLTRADELFRSFSADADTNITIRDYSLYSDKLVVIASENQPMSIYNAQAEYENDTITQKSMKSIKGYFVK